MKKVVILLAIFALAGMNLKAWENDFSLESDLSLKNDFSAGNGFTFRPLLSGGGLTASLHGFGGVGEFAFLFYDSGLQIGAHIVGRGGGININNDNHGAGSLGVKISFGGLWPNGRFRSYAFVEGGLGAAGGNYGAHVAGLFGGGGGLDWLFVPNASLYLEFGYLQHHLGGRFAGGPSISIGARSFF